VRRGRTDTIENSQGKLKLVTLLYFNRGKQVERGGTIAGRGRVQCFNHEKKKKKIWAGAGLCPGAHLIKRGKSNHGVPEGKGGGKGNIKLSMQGKWEIYE